MAIEPLSVEFQHTLILQAWDCLIGESKVVYVSGPITTGLQWVEALEMGADAGRSVIEANCGVIRRAAERIRCETGKLVLEPASLHVETWSQEDYLNLWMTLIERHASAVAFVAGWSYSIGCAHEFERAVLHDIPTLNIDGAEIGLGAGADLIARAAEDLTQRSHSNPKLSLLARRLGAVASRLYDCRKHS